MSRPRVGFLGVGWIGRHRMEAMLETQLVEVAAIADSSPEMVSRALSSAPGAKWLTSLDQMLALGLDGIVIATPSALHAGQAIQALRSGAAVFCQKPLGRSASEVEAIIAAARKADRLLAVDLSYRKTAGMQQIRSLVAQGGIGSIRSVDLVFHNAYGPDKSWFYDPDLSGGGCVMDLGVHLLDLAFWTLGCTSAEVLASSLSGPDGALKTGARQVEDLAFATLRVGDDVVVRLACSWRMHAGRDAVIEVSFYGTSGGLSLRNVNGSFYDFRAERYNGTQSECLAEPPDAWGGRAAAAWAKTLSQANRYDPEADGLLPVAQVLDQIYSKAGRSALVREDVQQAPIFCITKSEPGTC